MSLFLSSFLTKKTTVLFFLILFFCSVFVFGVSAVNEKESVPLNSSGRIETTVNAPFAIPVLTPEEAKKENDGARKELFQKRFLKQTDVLLHRKSVLIVLALMPFLLFVDAPLKLFQKDRKDKKGKRYFSLQRRFLSFCAVSLLVFGITVFVPWNIYFGNSGQFTFIFNDFFGYNIAILSISCLFLTLLILLIPPMISDWIVSVIGGLGLCIYIQSMFMNCYLGTMDGLEPDWSQHTVWGVINLLIWGVIVLIPLFLRIKFPSSFSAILSSATGAILFLEIFATGSIVLGAPKTVWDRNNTYYCDGSNQFQLSKKKNIIVFIMDQLGSSLVEPCFAADPQSKDALKDFIWYKNALSGYSLTYPSILSMLTGAYIDPAKDQFELFEKSWQSHSSKSFYKQMRSAGFDTRLFLQSKNILGLEEYFGDYFSNFKKEEITIIVDYKKLRDCLVQISGFSSVPYLLKKHFFYSNDFSLDVIQQRLRKNNMIVKLPTRNDTYYTQMVSNGFTADSNSPVFAIHYTKGAHPIWDVDEKCQHLSTPLDDIIPSARGCFYLLSELIRQLKAKDLYDNTAIIVSSDHGARVHKYSRYSLEMTFMIKPFNRHNNEIEICEKRYSGIDLLPTVLDYALGDKADFREFTGVSALRIPDNRERTVYVRYKHPDIPDFMGIDGTPKIYNCESEFIIDDDAGDNLQFVRYVPWKIDANVDESILRKQR